MLRSALLGLSFAMLAGGALAAESAIRITRSVQFETTTPTVVMASDAAGVTSANTVRFAGG